jgi:hypothetical protein
LIFASKLRLLPFLEEFPLIPDGLPILLFSWKPLGPEAGFELIFEEAESANKQPKQLRLEFRPSGRKDCVWKADGEVF